MRTPFFSFATAPCRPQKSTVASTDRRTNRSYPSPNRRPASIPIARYSSAIGVFSASHIRRPYSCSLFLLHFLRVLHLRCTPHRAYLCILRGARTKPHSLTHPLHSHYSNSPFEAIKAIIHCRFRVYFISCARHPSSVSQQSFVNAEPLNPMHK